MLVKQAKTLARQWIEEEGRKIPGFGGAFFHGSINWLPDDATLAPSSDVDIMVVHPDPNPPVKLGKFPYHDVLLEISYFPKDQLQRPEHVLSISHLAGSFRSASVIADPTGQLTTLQRVVAKAYAKRRWVTARCTHARDKVLGNFQSLNASASFQDQVLAWLFGTGVTTHILLVAGLKNPTVRQRYLATKTLLADYEQEAFYAPLLALLGCAQWSQAQAEQHLAALTAVFDVAKTVIKSPFFFASDINDVSRPIAIDGSREMIARGNHREAVFWLVATYSRCQKILYQDAPVELQEQFHPGYQALLADLGIRSFADLQQRSEQVRAFLPEIWRVAEAIMDANPAIEAS